MPELSDAFEEEETDKEIRGAQHDLTVVHAAYPCLEIVLGPAEGLRLPLDEGANAIGRSQKNAVKLDDSSVSRQHAVVARSGDSLTITDLGSRNGTVINDRKVMANLAVPLAHLDKIRIGIYLLRVLAREPTPEELEASDASQVGAVEEPLESSYPEEAPAAAEVATPMPALEHPAHADPLLENTLFVLRKRKITALVSAAVLVVLGLGAWWAYRVQVSRMQEEAISSPFAASVPVPVAIEPLPELTPRVATPPVAAPPVATSGVVAPPVAAPTPGVRSVFLRVGSMPLPAEIFMDERALGTTPLARNLDFEVGKSYTIKARYSLPEIRETFDVVQDVQIAAGQDMVDLTLVAELATVKISQLPRESSLYLEAQFAHDPTRTRSLKLDQIIYDKPLFVPYGRYTLELRGVPVEKRGSSVQEEILYRRTFELSGEHPAETIAVSDSALRVFPAEVSSTPAKADVLYDGKKLGQTPWRGELAIGKHSLVLRLSGFEDTTIPVDSWRNEPQQWSVTLKTSAAGALIFKAKEALKDRATQRAIDLLAEALGKDPTESEKSESYYYLGQSYQALKDYPKAINYFTRIAGEPFGNAAKLGLADCYYRMGETLPSLLALSQVLLASNDKALLADAEALFHEVTPIRSVVYLNTEPKGATVFVNEQAVKDPTPLLLNELSIGSYHIVAKLPGYGDAEETIQLKMSEFRPLMLTLKPIQ